MITRLILFLALTASATAADYYPPDARFGIYGAGVYQGIVGGIPNRAAGAQIYVTDYGWSGSNTAAQNSTALSNALGASAEGSVIHIPAGSYAFNGVFIKKSNNRHKRTIRGAGSGLTTLVVPNGVAALTVGDSPNFDALYNRSSEVTSVSRGSASVTLSSTSTMYAGYRQMFRIKFKNEAETPTLLTNSVDEGIRSIDVIGIAQSGSTLTLSQPMPHGYAEALAVGNATIMENFQLNYLTSGVGIEGIYFDCTAHTPSSPTYSASITYTEGLWLSDVRIDSNANFPLALSSLVNCEFTGSLFTGVGGGGAGRGGIIMDHCTNSLFEDNYIEGGPAIYHFGNNVNNVFAYNYFVGIVNVNHNPWSSHNLYEGNSYTNFQSDGFYGGSSADTFFRNWARYDGLGALKRGTRYYNMIGNIVGTIGLSAGGSDYTEHWGDPNIGNENYTGTDVQPSLGVWWPDWDVAAGRPKRVSFQLTTRTDAYNGILTIQDPALGDDFEARVAATTTSYNRHPRGFNNQFLGIGTRSGNDWPVKTNTIGLGSGNALPALNTIADITPGVAGFQQRDLDVLATTIRKANWYRVHSQAIRSGEELGVGETLPASYFRTSKPAYFGSLYWPPYDSSAPGTPTGVEFPAGYREINGTTDYLGDSAPTFSTHPTTQTATVGDSVTLTVAGGGSPAPTLQWRKGGVNISGATSSSLVLSNVQLADAGSYDCVATNSEGTATSTAATLTVNAAPSEGGTATIQTLNVGTLNIQ
jgi:hypothetical protein